MRTTVTLDDDVSALIDKVRREQGIGLSDALNRLIRDGAKNMPKRTAYVHRAVSLGLKVDVRNVAEVLDLLDQT